MAKVLKDIRRRKTNSCTFGRYYPFGRKTDMDIFEIYLRPPAERTENVGNKKEKVSMKSKSFRLSS